jgi:hypothetical protein
MTGCGATERLKRASTHEGCGSSPYAESPVTSLDLPERERVCTSHFLRAPQPYILALSLSPFNVLGGDA